MIPDESDQSRRMDSLKSLDSAIEYLRQEAKALGLDEVSCILGRALVALRKKSTRCQ
jgi:hypothetical protein